MSSAFSIVPYVEPWHTAALYLEFCEDTSQEKVDLITGAYRQDDGTPWVLPVVRKVEALLASEGITDYEYLPGFGCSKFTEPATALLLGKESKAIKEKRVIGVQTISCTGALYIGARFLVQHMGAKHYYHSAQNWVGFEPIFSQAGFERGIAHRYWDAEKRRLDMDGLLEDLSMLEPNSIVILQPCAHNPTGCDPTLEQWAQIAAVMKERNLFPIFDSVHQGFASGDFDEDAKVVRYFIDEGFEMICAQSFSKNMGLYNERVGILIFVTNDASTVPAVTSQLQLMIRGRYNTPPSHGAKIVSTILNDPELFDEWKQCMKTMCATIKRRKEGLRERLEKLETPGSWDYISSQVGMHTFLSLTPAQIQYLKTKHHVYAQKIGRFCMARLAIRDLDHVANSIHDTVINCKL